MITLFSILVRFKKIILIHILLMIVSISYSQFAIKYNTVDSIIENYMSEYNVPGFAACVVKDSMIKWSKSYGLANIHEKLPMDINKIMNIGSVSKTFTATAAMQLWEKGLIDLESDINEYLNIEIRNPKYPEIPITISQILTHTSSIKDGVAYGNSYSCGDPIMSLKEWIYNYVTPNGKYFNTDENFFDWSPGDKREYSNVAYGLLGLIVEEVSKLPFNEYCKENIFKPLGMNSTGWFIREIDVKEHIRLYDFVTKNNRDDLLEDKRFFPNEKEFHIGSYVEYCLYSFPNYPDGLVRTSIKDLSHFLISMLNGGIYNNSNILSDTTISKMLSLQIEGNNKQGLCWYKYDFESLWGHSGGDPGIVAYMVFNPDKNIGIITFQNVCVRGTFDVIKELYRIAGNND